MLYRPLNNPNQLKQVAGFIERLPAHAKVEAGGQQVGDKGYFYAATVVSGLKQDDHPERGLRAGHHRPVLHGRGPGHRVGPTASTTPSPPRTDEGPRPRDASVEVLDFGCV